MGEEEDLHRVIQQFQSQPQELAETAAIAAARKLKKDPSHENADAFLTAGFSLVEAFGGGDFLTSSWRRVSKLDT